MVFTHKRRWLFFVFWGLFPLFCYCQPTLVINPGNNQIVCNVKDSITLGGTPTASGGVFPYNYLWTPTIGMNDNHLSNPRIKATNPLQQYYLRVIDSNTPKDTATDSVVIYIDSANYASAGVGGKVCKGKPVTLGSPTNPVISYGYRWIPDSALSCDSCPAPITVPQDTVTYKMIVMDSANGCKDTFAVKLDAYLPETSVISPVNLKEGKSTNLEITGENLTYQWYSFRDTIIFNPTSATPEVEPSVTTMFYVLATDKSGCPVTDSVQVIVESDSDLVFYNTFTPNLDGINDTWYIGNINLFPNNHLYIFNRYGKIVYNVHGYDNLWDGKSGGEDLPAATYYYILESGTGKKYKGAVTIIRE